ncbi:hypothetical protein, partial [Enterobacter asburiae]|uniref:hypothetical protein n=1 Tax=Enterobacter asburiae TaxID=61645 RepID=UPI0021D1C33D
MTEWRIAPVATGLFREAMKGSVVSLLVFAVVMWLGGRPVQAAVETMLPERDITISGKVVAPSCQARLDNQMVSFTRRPVGVGKTQATENTLDADTRHLQLQLSECDFDGLGMTFKADTVSGYPERGALRGKVDSAISTDSYYTLGPVEEEYNGRPLFSLSDDSAQMVKGDG